MAGKQVVDARFGRLPVGRASPGPSQAPRGRPPPSAPAARPAHRAPGGTQQPRNRESRPRGFGAPANASSSSSSYEDEEEEDDALWMLDSYPDERKGGRRNERSLNHLLNFHYAERTRQEQQHVGAPRKHQAFAKPFRKEAFVQANYRFVVSDMGKSTTLIEDVNQPVEWDLIEQVLLSSSETYNCPICLDPPVAARITKCGHIYCAACIMRYLGESPNEWRRCPICFESVTRSHLKAALIQTVRSVAEGDELALILLQRGKNSSTLIPRNQWNQTADKASPRRVDDPHAVYARIVLAPDLLALLARQESEISEAVSLGRAAADESLPYLLLAQEDLQARQQRLKAELAAARGSAAEPTAASAAVDGWSESQAAPPSTSPPAAAAAAAAATATTPSSAPLLPVRPSAPPTYLSRPALQSSGDQGTTEMVHLYQVGDGQLIFLHPLNVRCLLREYGAAEGLPDTVSGRVLEVEEFVLTEALRKRHKHLTHLPLSCSLLFVELDLTHLLSPATLAAFASELSRRADRRTERLREKQASQEESQKTPAYRPEDFPAPEPLPVSDEVAPGEPAAVFEYPPLRASTSSVPSPTATPAAAAATPPSSSSSKPPNAWRSLSSPSAANTASADADESTSPSGAGVLSFKAVLSADAPAPKLDKLPRKNKKQVLAFSNSGARKYNG